MPRSCEIDGEPQVVHFHAGGLPGSRPILRGVNAKKTFDQIPIIDMSGMFSESRDDREQVAREVGKASREVGFFYAQNHRVPDEVVSRVFETIAQFFAQPHQDKMEIHVNKSAFFRGYEPLWETRLDPSSRGDMKEAFSMGDDGNDLEQKAPPGITYPLKNSWPENDPTFRKGIYDYYTHVLGFARKLLRIFALALELPEEYFDQICSFPMVGLRALYYPPQEVSDSTEVGIGAHTDFSLFTLVCQDTVSALQVLNENGIWTPAPPVPRSFVVNIGDFLMQITNNEFRSTVHRVVNLNGEGRYSIPCFFSPNQDATVTVLPKYRSELVKYPEINAGDYVERRFAFARPKHPNASK